MNLAWHYRWRLLVSLLVVGAMQRLSPWVHALEPAWFRLNGVPQPSVGLEVDGSEETTRISGVNSVYDTLFITPTVGLRTSGSIYHPNLLAFDFDGELGWGWDRMTTSGAGFNQEVNESEDLTRYLFQMYVLQEKPYNASFFAAQDHTYRDYGSFDTFTVDSTRYGGRISWNTANLSLTMDFGYRDESDSGLTDSSEVRETYANFLGIDKRQFGQTTLTARWDMFDNILNFGNTVSSLNESVGVSDSETFGQRKQITETAGASFSHSEYSAQQLDTVNANENITINHRPGLDSYLIVNAELNNLHPATELLLQGRYGVRHQLFESLTSDLDAHGSYQDNSDSLNKSTTDVFGLGVSEDYTKRLQSWGRLTIAAGIVADHQDDSSFGGGVLTSANENHQLRLFGYPGYRPVYLNRPKVVNGSIQVFASGIQLVETTDYAVAVSGELTEIQLLPSATVLPLLQPDQTLSVSVNYQSQSPNNASFETLNANIQIRLDLPHGLGVYGRVNWMDNDAPPIVLTQTLTDWVGGLDYHRRWFRTGAEYETYDSNFSQYEALRFFQDFNFSLDSRSSLSVNFNESFYHYVSNGDQTQYQMVTRYNLQLWSSISCYVQGGWSLQDVLGTEQLAGSAQAGLNWSRGKLSVRTGYEYNTQSTTASSFTEEREKNRIFAYLKRSF